MPVTEVSSKGLLIIVDQPILILSKAIVSSSNTGVVLTPSCPVAFNAPGSSATSFSGTIDLTTSTISSAASNLQVGDVIKYAIIVKNTGHGGSFQTKVSDSVPSNFTSITNLTITDGSGNTWSISSSTPLYDLQTTAGLNLGTIPPESGPQSVVVLTFDATIGPTSLTGSV